jgi:hypothetical protein
MLYEDTDILVDDLSDKGLIVGATNELKKTHREKQDILEKKVYFGNNMLERERNFGSKFIK